LETYLPGLEARGTPLLLDERHVSLEVVVHVELGVLLVDDFRGYRQFSILGPSAPCGCSLLPVVVADMLAVCDVLEHC
jgi:hypothetical protein